MNSVSTRTLQMGDKTVELETGRLTMQADAAVVARMGKTMVLATVVMGGESNLGYFPLQVEYQEKFFAGGKIKGSRWVKREGRPTDDAILTSRVIDRSIRPLFPDGFKREVQVIITQLSVDKENNPDALALLAVCAALEISPIPFNGPVVGMRVARNKEDGQFIINPTYSQMQTAELDMMYTASSDATIMVEANALEVSEDTMLQAFEAGNEVVRTVAPELTAWAKELGVEKVEYTPESFDEKIMQNWADSYADRLQAIVDARAQLKREDGFKDLLSEVAADEANAELPVAAMLDKLVKKTARKGTFEKGIRPDGRGLTEIRPISCEVDLLPMTHGSALFQRGQTQVLSVATLGSPKMAWTIDDPEGEEERHYMHFYNMPPFASGEAGRVGSPKRREIGHGALAERALYPVIPSQEEFPYTIMVVSEVLSSNGSTSQASVCGSTLSLMAAGVPIKKPVAGIAMGLMKEGDEFKILSDIQGLEDFTGDMDFKVAGTADGITAIQMDIKIDGLSREILEQALEQARIGRLHILEKMLAVISEPRAEVAASAPKIVTVNIPEEKIGELIGPGGKNIRELEATHGVELGVEQADGIGKVVISGINPEGIKQAVEAIEALALVFEAGMEFDGPVVRVEEYGVFVELAPGRSGLAHVSQLSTQYVRDANELYKVGDIAHVRVVETDGDRIKLTMLTPEQEEEQRANRPPRDGGDRPRGGFGGGSRGGYGGGRPRSGGFGGRGGGRSFGGLRRDFGDRGDHGGRSFDRPARDDSDRPSDY